MTLADILAALSARKGRPVTSAEYSSLSALLADYRMNTGAAGEVSQFEMVGVDKHRTQASYLL